MVEKRGDKLSKLAELSDDVEAFRHRERRSDLQRVDLMDPVKPVQCAREKSCTGWKFQRGFIFIISWTVDGLGCYVSHDGEDRKTR